MGLLGAGPHFMLWAVLVPMGMAGRKCPAWGRLPLLGKGAGLLTFTQVSATLLGPPGRVRHLLQRRSRWFSNRESPRGPWAGWGWLGPHTHSPQLDQVGTSQVLTVAMFGAAFLWGTWMPCQEGASVSHPTQVPASGGSSLGEDLGC